MIFDVLTAYDIDAERNPRFSDLEDKVFTFKDGDNYIAGGLPKCRKDTECPEGHFCNAGFDVSTNRCMPLKADNATCDISGGSHQCKSGHCQFGRCYTPYSVASGDTRYVNDACQKGKCSDVQGIKGRCVCQRDADCGDGTFCDAGGDLSLNSCKSLKADNETCDLVGGGHQCKSGVCKFSRCYTPNSVAMGKDCYNDDACKEGKCSSGACSGFPKYECKRPLVHATTRDHAFFNGGGLDVRHLAGGVKAAEYGVPMDSIHPGTPAIH